MIEIVAKKISKFISVMILVSAFSSIGFASDWKRAEVVAEDGTVVQLNYQTDESTPQGELRITYATNVYVDVYGHAGEKIEATVRSYQSAPSLGVSRIPTTDPVTAVLQTADDHAGHSYAFLTPRLIIERNSRYAKYSVDQDIQVRIGASNYLVDPVSRSHLFRVNMLQAAHAQ